MFHISFRCDGLGFVIICTALTYGCMLLSYVVKRLAQTPAVVERTIPVHKACLQLLDKLFVRLGIYFLVLFSVTLFLILDTKGSRERLISALGMVVLILLGTIFSKAPRSINWRQVKKMGICNQKTTFSWGQKI